MGNSRAIIMSGTMIASVILIVGVMFALPTTVETKTQNSALTILGHWNLVISDPQGNVISYIQADNFPTDLIKNEAQEVIFSGTAADANPMNFIALGTNGAGATTTGATALAEEANILTGRCDSAGGTQTDVPAAAGGAATSVRACTITIDASDDNETLIEVALFDSLLAAGTNEMGSVSTITPTVLLQTGMTIASTVTFTFS